MRGKFKKIASFVLILTLILSISGCGGNKTSGDEDYEAMTITIEGLTEENETITISELRELEQHSLSASYARTTGLEEEYEMEGPYLTDIIEAVGGNVLDYEGVGVVGSDGYYCLLSKEVIENTPDLMLSLIVDGKAKLDEEVAPAWLAVQGQFGPYWVKKVEKLILYDEIPEKNVTSIWSFNNLVEGIEPYEYEYYGSKDNSIDLEQIFTRFDYVDGKAFFTMKSSDGFKKNEVMNMVKSRYYIKYEGVDAPTNISPYIKLGMNVKNISWFSTNADAVIFPEKLEEYLELKTIDGKEGVTLKEILYDVELDKVTTETFDIIGKDGNKVTIKGEYLDKAILSIDENSISSVIFDESLGFENIKDLMRIKLIESENSDDEEDQEDEEGKDKDEDEQSGDEELEENGLDKVDGTTGNSTNINNGEEGNTSGNESSNNSSENDTKKDVALIIEGNGVTNALSLSLEELKGMDKGYFEGVYSTVNNWPTKKMAVAKGVDIKYLLEKAGIKSNASTIVVEARDGYNATFTKNQLMDTKYSYLGLMQGEKGSVKNAKSIIAYEYESGTTNISNAEDTKLRLVLGQYGLNDVNTIASVQNVYKIKVSTGSAGSWAKPTASIESGMVEKGTEIALNHDSMDQVKIYYTLDGTTPNYDSNVYNKSTTYFQPDLIKPIVINEDTTIKVLVTGYGKANSGILELNYTVK